jgi:hypothetical protein
MGAGIGNGGLRLRERQELRNKRREYRGIKEELRAPREAAEAAELRRRREAIRRELREMEARLAATMRRRAATGPKIGALPHFVIIGASRSGTTSLYHLLARHPLIEPAESKELHFFDKHFREGIGWYRSCFPPPMQQDGRNRISGESTPYYLFHPHAARRIAQTLPETRLLALLRNPVDRAYSQYQQQVKRGREPLSFEEAVEAEEQRLEGEWHRMSEDEGYDSYNLQRYSYLARGVYVDQLLRWRQFFADEQMLVLQSEEFFERPRDALRRVVRFLDLPTWEPTSRDVEERRNRGVYAGGMNPHVREKLESYFGPHNRRLYELLGTDFAW